jgi:hypothetical protein
MAAINTLTAPTTTKNAGGGGRSGVVADVPIGGCETHKWSS